MSTGVTAGTLCRCTMPAWQVCTGYKLNFPLTLISHPEQSTLASHAPGMALWWADIYPS